MQTMLFFVSHLQIKDNNELTGPIPDEVNTLCEKTLLICRLEDDGGSPMSF